MTMVCSVNDVECVPGRLKCGMCEKHYRRMRSSGSTANPRIDNWTRYHVKGDCWIWDGPLYANGYGQMSRPYRGTQLAHRGFYFHFVSVIPRHVDLDHLCRVRSCVNPAHLEPVTRKENLSRGAGTYGSRNKCKKGLHDITDPENVRLENGVRTCKECWRTRYRRAGAKYRAKHQ